MNSIQSATNSPASFIDEHSGDSTHSTVSKIDEAMIELNRLDALSALLSIEEVSSEFARLETVRQAAIFGLFEAGIETAQIALSEIAQVQKS